MKVNLNYILIKQFYTIIHMIINKLFLYSFALILWAGAVNAQPDNKYNLDAEKADATGQPLDWFMNGRKTKGHMSGLDSLIVKQGKYSLNIKVKKSKIGVCGYKIPAKYQGSVIELRAYMKTQNVSKRGYAGLWMRIDGQKEGSMLGLENMSSAKINGTNPWKEYRIKLPLFGDAKQVYVGGLLTGETGQIWVDDFRIFIDGTPLNKVPLKTSTAFVESKSYHETSAQDIRKNLLKSWTVVKQRLSKYHQQQGLKYGASLSLIMDGKLYDNLQLGYADREAKRKVDNRQIHQWASISKTFTTTAILQLAEQGKLKLSDPITQYIPALATVKDTAGKSRFDDIKLHHLVTHSGNFSGYAVYDTVLKQNPNYPYENTHCFDDWMKYKDLIKFLGKPGKKYRYSNWGYSYLGMVIEKVSGMKFKDYIQKYIFKPLTMQDAFFSTPTNAQHRRRMAACYQEEKNGRVKRYKPVHDQCFEEANGGIKATVSDMIKWMNFYSQTATSSAERARHAKVLKPSIVKKYFSIPNFAAKGKAYHADSLRFRADNWSVKQFRVAGFQANQTKGNQSIRLGHTGHQYNYISRVFWHPKGNFGIIYTQNTEAYSNTPAKIFETMLSHYYYELLDVTDQVIKR